MDRKARLDDIRRRRGVVAVCLFGSRAEEGRRCLEAAELPGAGRSDLDVGVFFVDGRVDVAGLGALQAELAEVLEPLRVDVVPLDRVDPLFQFNALQGFRAAAVDSMRADENELLVMRRAAGLLPIQRQIEIERFGVSTA
jgi:predicted nucleotidyltransferase